MRTTITYSTWRVLRYCLNIVKDFVLALILTRLLHVFGVTEDLFIAGTVVILFRVFNYALNPVKRFIKSCYTVVPFTLPEEDEAPKRWQQTVIPKGRATL